MLLKIGLIAELLTTPPETPVANAAEQNNVVVNMGCGYRWHPGFQKVKEIVDS